MPPNQKIATCCYCGTRAMLVLDKGRHELSCSSCGAPLHDMKMLPLRQVARKAPPVVRTDARRPNGSRAKPQKEAKRGKKRRKPLTRRIAEELWDIVEDIFD